MMDKTSMAGWLGFFLLASSAFASPRIALCVQNRAGAPCAGRLDTFSGALSARLSQAGFGVADAAGTSSLPPDSLDAAGAVALARPARADYLVMASILSVAENTVRSRSGGLPRSTRTRVLRLSLHVFDGRDGTRLHGGTVIVADPIDGGTEPADPLGGMLHRGAAEMADRIRAAVEGGGGVRSGEDATQALPGSPNVKS